MAMAQDSEGPGQAGGGAEDPGSRDGAVRATDRAAAQAVGARAPASLGQGGPVSATAAAATVGLGMPGSGPPDGAFDGLHPPDAALIGDCVHCGFCLPTCPTYVLWGEEMDSPRGRIDIMKGGLEGDAFDAGSVRHLDQCLGCMACVTACPSGVQYDKLIEATRAQLERRVERPRAERLLRTAVYSVFPYPRRLRALRGPLRAYQATGLGRLLARSGVLGRLPEPLRAMESLAPKLGRTKALPPRIPARGTRRRTVGLLTGCVQGAFFPDVNAATVRVLAAEGCDVVVPRRQGCCGALSAHAGRESEALTFAKQAIETFEAARVETVVVNAAGCGSHLKEYAHLLRDEPGWPERARAMAAKVRDITELLDELGPVAKRHPLPMKVAYQDACHLAHAQRVREQPRRLLRGVPGVQLRELAESEICCGSAGTYNLLHPGPARELGERKANAVLATGAEVMVTANPGCWMQVATTLAAMGERMPVAHTIQVLDASIRGVPVDRLLARALDGPGTALPASGASRAARPGAGPAVSPPS
ncbi:(Fe-S)-binding protein [Streptomyces montanisoli]|uniref:4Fe-4S dicluster domain-containing protein n=1 Tax=Streptomyces montanisoli TaxID=2798581 RepID=A0A940MEY9_9ACTN|nr:heterodisulfide reductase-related iron-sulfur binding cluster [Streptomyces montanisoli]MBP0457891.1 4Fe-4S dicluster domain-containing protein [Streptomyces montanisoli]